MVSSCGLYVRFTMRRSSIVRTSIQTRTFSTCIWCLFGACLEERAGNYHTLCTPANICLWLCVKWAKIVGKRVLSKCWRHWIGYRNGVKQGWWCRRWYSFYLKRMLPPLNILRLCIFRLTMTTKGATHSHTPIVYMHWHQLHIIIWEHSRN